MTNKINSVLAEVLGKIVPEKEEIFEIERKLKEFLSDFRKKIKKKKIDAEVFVGGSFAKNTIIKKEYYDIDVFLRFDKKYANKDISGITKKILSRTKKVQEIHGSRNYFRVKISQSFFIEIVPVLKISNPKEAENITDLS